MRMKQVLKFELNYCWIINESKTFLNLLMYVSQSEFLNLFRWAEDISSTEEKMGLQIRYEVGRSLECLIPYYCY
jgi:hypothetical protein